MNRRFAITAGIGCAALVLLLLVAIPAAFLLPTGRLGSSGQNATEIPGVNDSIRVDTTQAAVPTITAAPQIPQTGGQAQSGSDALQTGAAPGSLINLYKELNPGVVNIRVFVQQGPEVGQGAGSGFILDDQGHIVTNDHVVEGATDVIVVFYNGDEARAEVVGKDNDSDLAVIRVDHLAEGAHPLSLGDSDRVQVGEWVIAIGNPFGYSSSMTTGIVSAIGRTIPSLETGFSIPLAIQTDTAINPGNSGGPLLNLNGKVVGVNAQIAAESGRANAGVGFAIPVNLVRRVIPVLIERGEYQWPWMGITGTDVNLEIAEANRLNTQDGAYITSVIPGGPADRAGVQGSQDLTGGDIVLEVDGQPVVDFADLLVKTALKNPGDQMDLTIFRNGQTRQVTLTLEPRPANFNSTNP